MNDTFMGDADGKAKKNGMYGSEKYFVDIMVEKDTNRASNGNFE